jgi:glycosyltransferase involved in cell wall biosynthesis
MIPSMPRVSLVLPVYNGSRFIAQESICRAFAAEDARIKYVRNETNLGAGPNHNKGFKLSSGEYFKWCACDDYIGPAFLERCVSALDLNPDVALVYGTTKSVDSHGSLIPLVGSMGPDVSSDPPALRYYKILRDKGTCYEIFGLFRRDILAHTTLQRMYYGSDHSLLAETGLLGRFLHVPDAIFYNREHEDRSINIKDTASRVLWQDTSAKSKYSLEHIKQFNHLIEIALRHRSKVPVIKTLSYLLLFELRPLQLMRHALDLICMTAPSSRSSLRNFGWQCVRLLRNRED